MTRVLYFVDRLRRGGIQSLLYDMLRVAAYRDEVCFDVLTLDDGEHYALEDNISSLGVKVYKLTGVWLRRPTDILHYRRELKRFFAEHHNYDAVHLNSSSKNFLVLRYARKAGIPVRIAHAHNAGFQTRNPIYGLIGNLLKPMLCREATDLVACSQLAGEWMFGRNAATERMQIIANGIVTDDFRYSGDWRSELRSSLGVPDNCLLMGCVGRLVKQKNQEFLLKIAQELNRFTESFRIVLIGAGEMEQELRQLATRLSVADKIIFLGFREDRNRWYSALDIFVLPSLYEGLPVTLIEAQAAGLPAIVADTVTTEAALSGNVRYLPISAQDAPKQWAKLAMQFGISTEARLAGAERIVNAGFDISTTLSQLTLIYSIHYGKDLK